MTSTSLRSSVTQLPPFIFERLYLFDRPWSIVEFHSRHPYRCSLPLPTINSPSMIKMVMFSRVWASARALLKISGCPSVCRNDSVISRLFLIQIGYFSTWVPAFSFSILMLMFCCSLFFAVVSTEAQVCSVIWRSAINCFICNSFVQPNDYYFYCSVICFQKIFHTFLIPADQTS